MTRRTRLGPGFIRAVLPASGGTSYNLIATPAAYTLTGHSATFPAARHLVASPASFGETAGAATFAYTPAGSTRYNLIANPAAYTLSGHSANFPSARHLTADPAAYGLTGGNATFTRTSAGARGGIFIRPMRSSLAFPADVAPGVNPAHPAFNGLKIRHACVAMATNKCMVNLLTGQPLISVGTNFSQRTPFGPMFNPNTGTNGLQMTPVIAGESFNAFMAAGIIYVSGTSSGGQTLITINRINVAATNLITFGASGIITFASQGIGYTLVPALQTQIGGYYFFAISALPGSGHRIAGVLVDLRTGATINGSSAQAFNASQTVGSFYGVGTINAGGTTPCWLATAMMGNYYVPPQTLQTWAQDPWAFWYPRTFESFSFSRSVGSPPPPVMGQQARAVVMA